MSTAQISEHPPIYGQLINERGDVVAEARKAAEQTQAQARDALDFGGMGRGYGSREARAFSAFG